MQYQEIGRLGEARAADFLYRKGFVIIAQNLRVPPDEIDILARRNSTIHLIEVKTSLRRVEAYNPEMRLNWQKRRALARAARAISARYPSCNIQVDAITLYLQQPESIMYYPAILTDI